MRPEELLAQMAEARQRNIELYARLAAQLDAASVGFTPRRPGEPDVTLELLRLGARTHPAETAEALRRIVENDRVIDALSLRLSAALQPPRERRFCATCGRGACVAFKPWHFCLPCWRLCRPSMMESKG